MWFCKGGTARSLSSDAPRVSNLQRKLLLATGVTATLPAIEGFTELWGPAYFHCPYCHGWEVEINHWRFMAKEKPVGNGTDHRLGRNLIFCSDGDAGLSGKQKHSPNA